MCSSDLNLRWKELKNNNNNFSVHTAFSYRKLMKALSFQRRLLSQIWIVFVLNVKWVFFFFLSYGWTQIPVEPSMSAWREGKGRPTGNIRYFVSNILAHQKVGPIWHTFSFENWCRFCKQKLYRKRYILMGNMWISFNCTVILGSI